MRAENTGAGQLREWSGAFGNAYTDRNVVDWRTRLPLFKEMLRDLTLPRVLEAGCNRGHNLLALRQLLGPEADVVGVEPNRHARTLARELNPELNVFAGDTYHLPFASSSFDLTLTWGVLIHVPLAQLPTALTELHRVSRRYVLTVEYFAQSETVIPYRGHDNLLWKRDFRQHFQSQFPELRLLRQGFWGKEHGADNVSWWLFDKASGSVPPQRKKSARNRRAT